MTAQTLRRLGKPQLLHEAVQEELKRYIAENSLRPGDSLPSESELARQLGVGRNSVREAVKSLEALGILEVRVGSGLFVRELSLDPVRNYLAYVTLLDLKRLADVRDIRMYLETGLADRVIERSTDEQLGGLRRTLDEWLLVSKTGRYAPELDRAFHEGCWKRLDNELLSNILETFWQVQAQALKRASIPDPADPVAHHRVHEAIYEAIVAREPEQLRQAIAIHYAGIQARVAASARRPGRAASRPVGSALRPVSPGERPTAHDS
jgi:DNA-binding FadR family transcriptional regulator